MQFSFSLLTDWFKLTATILNFMTCQKQHFSLWKWKEICNVIIYNDENIAIKTDYDDNNDYQQLESKKLIFDNYC